MCKGLARPNPGRKFSLYLTVPELVLVSAGLEALGAVQISDLSADDAPDIKKYVDAKIVIANRRQRIELMELNDED